MRNLAAVAVLVVGLLVACAAPAAADPPGMNGMHWTGTVTSKSYDPAHTETVCRRLMGCVEVERPECWRLDLSAWGVGIPVWACTDRDTWDRAEVGDYYDGETVR